MAREFRDARVDLADGRPRRHFLDRVANERLNVVGLAAREVVPAVSRLKQVAARAVLAVLFECGAGCLPEIGVVRAVPDVRS